MNEDQTDAGAGMQADAGRCSDCVSVSVSVCVCVCLCVCDCQCVSVSVSVCVCVPARASVTASVTLPMVKLILSEKCGRAPTVRYSQMNKVR